jgi:hypothetical protein
MRPRAAFIAGVIASMILGACSTTATTSSTTIGSTTTSIPTVTSTTVATTSTTADALTTTSAAATTTTVADDDVYEAKPTLGPPEALPGSDGASGSGCAPGPGPLPDGVWFGFAVDADASSVTFDLACFFYGDAANEAAEEDGFDEIPVPNDYWIRNEVHTTRVVPFDDEAVVHTLGADIEDEPFETVSVEDWLGLKKRFIMCPGDSCLVWLYVNGDHITELVEQYTP